jgi:hypothetical protein
MGGSPLFRAHLAAQKKSEKYLLLFFNLAKTVVYAHLIGLC